MKPTSRNKLPDQLVGNLHRIFTPGTVDKMVSAMASPRLTTCRINTLLAEPGDVMRALNNAGCKHEKLPWCPDALLFRNTREKELERLDLYERGAIYLQSLSSQIPVRVLEPQPGEKVLDIAAAPGSKTTQMAALMENQGWILANELNSIRAERLNYNLAKQGVRIAQLNIDKGERVGERYPETFDRVLVDAPCSGEGRIQFHDPASYRRWSESQVRDLAALQKKLLSSAWRGLKPGGILVYSTCTLNKTENEEVIDWALAHLTLQIQPITLRIPGAVMGMANGLHPSISYAIRLIPTSLMEGFFICRLIKTS
ncbi:MAG: RsmB/NOP family class I SAM-dependent RNA methyltransferase [Candidatus Delongbacteria bacterium]|nr:RsmB/NOP family class I SAM-dependent RNA methyltransferase [Candidatus Delongbacteria bacterium]